MAKSCSRSRTLIGTGMHGSSRAIGSRMCRSPTQLNRDYSDRLLARALTAEIINDVRAAIMVDAPPHPAFIHQLLRGG